MSSVNPVLAAKLSLRKALAAFAEAGSADTEHRMNAVFEADCVWRVAHPINNLNGNTEALAHLWLPLKEAMPDLERRDVIFVGGVFQDRLYIAAVGHYCGIFRNDWLSIPATARPVHIRYGEVYEIRNGKVVQANLLWDILDLIRQSGFWPIAPSLGTEEMWTGPITGNGIVLHPTDEDQSAASLAQTLAMHRSLFEYDDKNLSRQGLMTMKQKDYWHPKMMWYGPAGIGTTRGLQGFVDDHQLPFRIAFERPQGTLEEVETIRAQHGAGHYVRIGDGPYSVTGGWPSVYATHTGGGFAGTAPTGRPVTMRVMDFYLHHEGLIRENWVPLDVLDLLNQMGLDVIGRLQSQRGIDPDQATFRPAAFGR